MKILTGLPGEWGNGALSEELSNLYFEVQVKKKLFNTVIGTVHYEILFSKDIYKGLGQMRTRI